MDISIRRFDTKLPLPEYKTPGAAATDLYVRDGAIIQPKTVEVLRLNVAIQLPQGHFALMAARSSLWKRGLMLANSVAIIDEDFAGDGDEYQVALYNFSDELVEVKAGERITQLIVLPYDRVDFKEVTSLGNADRGAYGTTGL